MAGDGGPTPSALLTVASRELTPGDILFGGVWLGPGHGNTDFGQDAVDATIAAAVAAGITDFDTAPAYGSGAAEERLGRAVQKLVPSAAGVVTKAGILFRDPDGTPSISSFDAPGSVPYSERIQSNDYTGTGARSSFQDSLARMGLTSIHGLRIHDPNDNELNSKPDFVLGDEVAVALSDDGIVQELRKMREEGLIKEVSLGMNCDGSSSHQGAPGEIVRLIRGAGPGTFDTAMLAGGWNLLCQDGLPCLLECQRFGIRALVAGTFASGLLVGVDRYAYNPAPEPMKEKARRWKDLAEKHGTTLPAVAVAFAALPTCVSRVALGMATVEQVEMNLAIIAESKRVPAAIWAEAKAEGLLDEAVPVP